jgi:hypothetical protein
MTHDGRRVVETACSASGFGGVLILRVAIWKPLRFDIQRRGIYVISESFGVCSPRRSRPYLVR